MNEAHHSGMVLIDFSDWTPLMTALAIKLHQLPSKPGVPPSHRNHVLAIDRLHQIPLGDVAIDLLAEHIRDFEYCPDGLELFQLGQALLEFHTEVQLLCERRRRNRAHLQDRTKAQARADRPKRIVKLVLPTPKHGFRLNSSKVAQRAPSCYDAPARFL
jgi:hypothetical protein